MDTLDKLIACLAKLPGIGRRSAERMALQLIRDQNNLLIKLVAALNETKENICCCSLCGNVTPVAQEPCRLCTDPGRDDKMLCVVENPNDIMMMERSGGYHGRYHALMGKISTARGEAPHNLRLKALVERIDSGHFSELVLALSTDGEGEATAGFICDLLKDRDINISRLALGLPAGSAIMYSDPVTLSRALKGRQPA